MAISSTHTVLSCNSYEQKLFRSKNQFSAPLIGPKTQLISTSSDRVKLAARSHTTPRVLSKPTEAVPSETKTDKPRPKPEPDHPPLAETWREFHGENNWEGLLDPMHPPLRAELIRYGEMTQACYDAFDFDPYSKYCGSCKYAPQEFFKRLGMDHYGYDVARYLFATSNINLPNFFKKSRWPQVWSTNANWIGYIAVSNDERSKSLGRRDIIISWRGTVTNLEWVADLMDILTPVSKHIPCPDPTVKAEAGFLDLYTDKKVDCDYCHISAREQIETEVKKIVARYPNEELSISIMGHSLGSALAMLSGFNIVETGLNVTTDGRKIPVCIFSFAGPRVGNIGFKERVEKSGLKVLRIFNIHDVVPKSPGFIFNENMPQMPQFLMKFIEGLPWTYFHIGVKLQLDHKKSPYLRTEEDVGNFHNLEAHLHLIDGYHGEGKKFELTTGRDPALVNKSCDFLQDHLMIPPNWRQDENKGLVRTPDGRWTEPERPKHV
ncbi:Phospholipase [Actinidia chinensis var. chinensis]|uniref:Phospholipase n=1 Tax=Actinidia chinensis var. chinensis TaxID=1590841 RepID=A0A2R6QTX6_ACTCC|nr:Phospholipase [Actinidia chinensis var. chinensis]